MEEAVETAGVGVVEVEMGTAEVAMVTAVAEGRMARVRAAMAMAVGEMGMATAAAATGRVAAARAARGKMISRIPTRPKRRARRCVTRSRACPKKGRWLA